ncbi:MAG: MarR family transcriptional regulator, partial [Halioglobus sp.]
METNQGLFLLHLLRFPGRYQSQMMRRLGRRGYADLRLSFSPVITELSRDSQRLTDLAAWMGMQKQNCAQLVRRIEAAGYIERRADPADGRSRLLALNARGRALVRDGVAVIGELDGQLSEAIGPEAFVALGRTVQRLHHAVFERPGPSDTAAVPGALINALIELAGHAGSELNALVRARGYAAIRPVHEQVLLHLGEGRLRIQDIARENDVSRQAIGAVVNELQDLGYIRLEVDP